MIYDEITIENGFCTVNYYERKHVTDGSAKMLRNESVEISLDILVFTFFRYWKLRRNTSVRSTYLFVLN